MEKNSVRNLQYGPKTRLIRGMYRAYNTKKLNISTTKMIVLFEALGLIDSNAIVFNSSISNWAGPHNHFWASANIKIKFD